MHEWLSGLKQRVANPIFIGSNPISCSNLWGCSSNGRAADSKPDGWQFKSVHPCHFKVALIKILPR